MQKWMCIIIQIEQMLQIGSILGGGGACVSNAV